MKHALVALVIATFGGSAAAFVGCSSDTARAVPTPADASSDAAAALPAPTVLCTQSADGTFFCTCNLNSGDAGAYAPVEAGAELRYATSDDCEMSTLGGDPLLCCADDNYPASGSCDCAPSASQAPYHCKAIDPLSCQCAYSANPFDAGGSCDLDQYDGGTCCAYRASEFVDSECSCFAASQGVTCGGAGSGSVSVSSCTSAADAGLQVVTAGCPKGTRQVMACGAHPLP